MEKQTNNEPTFRMHRGNFCLKESLLARQNSARKLVQLLRIEIQMMVAKHYDLLNIVL